MSAYTRLHRREEVLPIMPGVVIALGNKCFAFCCVERHDVTLRVTKQSSIHFMLKIYPLNLIIFMLMSHCHSLTCNDIVFAIICWAILVEQQAWFVE